MAPDNNKADDNKDVRPGEHPWDRMIRRQKEHDKRWAEGHEASKLRMRYASVQITKRLWMIMKYDGAAYHGE